jgi:hypothetical protein
MKSNALLAVLMQQFLWHISVACLITVLQAFRCCINKVKPRLLAATVHFSALTTEEAHG